MEVGIHLTSWSNSTSTNRSCWKKCKTIEIFGRSAELCWRLRHRLVSKLIHLCFQKKKCKKSNLHSSSMVRTFPISWRISLDFGHIALNLAIKKLSLPMNKKKPNEDKAPSQPKETYFQKYLSGPKPLENYRLSSNKRSNGQRCCSDSPCSPDCNGSRNNSSSGIVRSEVLPETVNSLSYTVQSCNPLH